MEFVIKNLKESTNALMRKIGYKPAHFQGENEASIVRQIGRNDYPRFHLYIKEKSFVATATQDKLNTFVFNLHLDQKKPSYQGSQGQKGEYDGGIGKEEAERIRNLLL